MGYMDISLLCIVRLANRRLLVLIALFAYASLPLYAAGLNDLTYTTTDGKVTITDCNKAAAGDLVIPETIRGNPVTSIGELAFGECYNLTKITIPNGVVSIGNQAFIQCFDLEKITIPDGVVSIGEEAFIFCVSLRSIKIPDSVTSIKRAAFRRCVSLRSITIGNGVTSIGDVAFQDSSLSHIIFQGVAPTVAPNAFKGLPSEVVAYVSAEALSSFDDPGDDWSRILIQVGDGTPKLEPSGDGTPSPGGAFAGFLLSLLLFGGIIFLGVKFGSSSSSSSGGGGCGGGCGGGG